MDFLAGNLSGVAVADSVGAGRSAHAPPNGRDLPNIFWSDTPT